MYICICEGVTDKQIKSAIAEGANSVRDLRDELGITSQCGQCSKCAKKILREHSGKSAWQKFSRKVPATDVGNVFPPLQEATA